MEDRFAEKSEESNFTSVEQQILELLASGMKAREIAEELHYSPGTINVYLSTRIYPKLKVNNKVAAIAEAERLGLLPSDEIDLNQALEIAKKAGRLSLNDMDRENSILLYKYRALIHKMEEKMRSSDPTEMYAGMAFTGLVLARQYKNLSQQAHQVSDEVDAKVWRDGRPSQEQALIPLRYYHLARTSEWTANLLRQRSYLYELKYTHPS
jgi:DNA-binding CsgD family transcriptional regulator